MKNGIPRKSAIFIWSMEKEPAQATENWDRIIIILADIVLYAIRFPKCSSFRWKTCIYLSYHRRCIYIWEKSSKEYPFRCECDAHTENHSDGDDISNRLTDMNNIAIIFFHFVAANGSESNARTLRALEIPFIHLVIEKNWKAFHVHIVYSIYTVWAGYE